MGSVERLLKLLFYYISLLDNLSIDDLNDVYKYLSAVYLLQVQAQSLIDIVVKAASAMGFEVEGYIDAGNKLMNVGLLSNEEFSRYRSVVRFRNN
ncbi:MAG: HepT-like ribonuclease domain-containing protein [Vulcanisaeta sp.]|uniref:HepT-like ribonuclease domain-containing protein n=1 Tax=Vulcanisaeta sp. TaxID=2020871 RepID=UPI003D0D4CE3